MRAEPVLDRILRRITVTDQGCWEFQGCRLKAGYGHIRWGDRLWLVHRVTYIHLVGEIPEELEIDHLCKNKPCCNPDHLEPVTRSENIRRGTQWHHWAQRERAKTHCPRMHPYDETNTEIVKATGQRRCRECGRIASRNAYKKRTMA